MIFRLAKLSLLILFFISCKKDKLTDDKEILIGTWNWYSTTKSNSLCNPPSYETELSPSTENKTYTIKFFKKGKVTFLENDTEKKTYRIVFYSFDAFGCQNPNFTDFSINMNNHEEFLLQGCVSSDSMTIIRNFPFPDPEDACEKYTSYFVKG